MVQKIALWGCLLLGCQTSPSQIAWDSKNAVKKSPSVPIIESGLPQRLQLQAKATPVDLVPSNFEGKSHLAEEGASDLIATIDSAIVGLQKRSPSKTHSLGSYSITSGALQAQLIDLREKVLWWGIGTKLATYLETNYIFLETAAPSFLLTGYYETVLRGSRKREGKYQYPLYRVPSDLIAVAKSQTFPYGRARLLKDGAQVPYYSRLEIDQTQALAGLGLELVWVDDPVARSFLQIQGSGLIELTDGTIMRVGFADKNGLEYKAIGRWFVERDLFKAKDLTMQKIKEYLLHHPENRDEVLAFDPSYVFFKEYTMIGKGAVPLAQGPIGSQGVPLTPLRSVAVDTSLFPLGALMYLKSQIPAEVKSGEASDFHPLNRLVIAQDTGGAIKGPGRMDMFVGRGEERGALAGVTKEAGTFFLMIKP